MTDIYSKRKRSELMSKISSKGNRSTEVRVVEIFRKNGIRGWRRHSPLPGRPDFIFPKARLAIFIDGCFWHGCPLHFKSPSTNVKFWEEKISANRTRDKKIDALLRAKGWTVLRFWEHDLKDFSINLINSYIR